MADTLSQTMDGAVVVQALDGTFPNDHGPGLGFYPAVINLSPAHLNATFNYLCAPKILAPPRCRVRRARRRRWISADCAHGCRREAHADLPGLQ